jgi:Leucine-rich repeat (LRR) protein
LQKPLILLGLINLKQRKELFMSSRVSQPRSPEQGCGVPHDPLSPIAPTPSSADVSVSEVAKKVLLDPTVPPSDGSCPFVSIANGDNQPFYERLTFYLSQEDQTGLALTCMAFLQKELEPLLTSFGITYPYAKENKEQALERITTILNPLKKSAILTENEKNHFSVLSAEKIIQNPKLLYLLLNTADRYNLVTMISKKVPSLDLTEKSFPQKVTAVLEYLQQKRKTIEKIKCAFLRLTNIPEEIYDLKDLVDLDIGSNKLTSLPDSLGSVSNLQWLSVGNNNLTSLPDSLGCLSRLEQLFVDNNNLTSLPDSLGSLSSLSSLRVQHNNLTSLPDSLGGLSRLYKLSVHHNNLTSLPDWLGRLSRLERLSVDHNSLTSLPDSLGSLSSLQFLSVSDNHLTALPDSIGGLSRLFSLRVGKNPLTDLPEWLNQLPQLKRIVLAEDDNIKIPASLRGKVRHSEGW